jgi:hypothetical protein
VERVVGDLFKDMRIRFSSRIESGATIAKDRPATIKSRPRLATLRKVFVANAKVVCRR